MITFHVGNRPANDILAVIDLLGAEAFTSPTRSTVPLIDYWREPGHRLTELSAALGTPLAPPVDLTFEFAVPVAHGRGKDSFTDLMITSATAAVAIEAKYTESRYETVEEWLGTSPTPNREAVLTGWLAHIAAPAQAAAVPVSAVLGLPYQLVHRVASVCAVPRPARAVVYPGVSRGAPSHYVDDLRTLRRLVPAGAPVTFAVLACPTERLARLADRARPAHGHAGHRHPRA